jgi:hypothetical protein
MRSSFKAESRLALLGRDRVKGGGLLLYILTATIGAFGILLIVLVQGQSCFEGFMTIETNIIVDGHGDLP